MKVTKNKATSVSLLTSALNDKDAKKNAIEMLQTHGRRGRPVEWAPGPTSLETEIMKRIDASDTPAFLEKKAAKRAEKG